MYVLQGNVIILLNKLLFLHFSDYIISYSVSKNICLTHSKEFTCNIFLVQHFAGKAGKPLEAFYRTEEKKWKIFYDLFIWCRIITLKLRSFLLNMFEVSWIFTIYQYIWIIIYLNCYLKCKILYLFNVVFKQIVKPLVWNTFWWRMH